MISSFGCTSDGKDVDLYRLENQSGLVAEVMTYGATLVRLLIPQRNKPAINVVLGFDNIKQYETESPYFGATIGRYANRIAKGQFELNSKKYTLAINNGPHALHGGLTGFDKQIWTAEHFKNDTEQGVSFSHRSPDMEEGFPGNLAVKVTYTWTEKNGLRLEYEASTDKPTPINLTNHSYFNLGGAGAGNVLDHTVTIQAQRYTPVDADLIPTGTHEDVAATAMDFRSAVAIGARIEQVEGGYDHNYVISSRDENHTLVAAVPRLAAEVADPATGRKLTCYTTEPGVQFYTGNFLDGSITGNGGVYKKHAGFTLEAQHFPDSVNRPNFPDTILRPGEVYRQVTIYKLAF